MFILLILYLTASIFMFFQLPERLCYETRICQLFFQSHFWFAFLQLLIFLVFVL
jgi:hypothetical protein